MSIPRIKIWLEGRALEAFYSIAHEFSECGKAASLGLTPNSNRGKNFKFNDSDFLCVYTSIDRVMGSDRYPTKEGNEYEALKEIRSFMESEFEDQRGISIDITLEQ